MMTSWCVARMASRKGARNRRRSSNVKAMTRKRTRVKMVTLAIMIIHRSCSWPTGISDSASAYRLRIEGSLSFVDSPVQLAPDAHERLSVQSAHLEECRNEPFSGFGSLQQFLQQRLFTLENWITHDESPYWKA